MSARNRPVICLTPVKNEAWILERFLRCAELWADHVVVADQGSDDGSPDIALRHAKVSLIRNEDPKYDEGARQRILLEKARRISPGALLVALDADEALTSNWSDSEEWQQVLQARPGTVIQLRWVNLRPDLRTCWIPPVDIPFAYVDDGKQHAGSVIHSSRVPVPPDAPRIVMHAVRVLHYQYTDWERMQSKQRWYQCWERVQFPSKRPIALYRQYHHMDAVRDDEVRDVDPAWLSGYEAAGIDMTAVIPERPLRSDADVLRLLIELGEERFRKLDIWDVDWAAVGRSSRGGDENYPIHDPRSIIDRAIHQWLRRTQPRCDRVTVRAAQVGLRLLGW